MIQDRHHEAMDRMYHVPRRLRDLAKQDPVLYTAVHAYANGAIEYVAMLEAVVEHLSMTTKDLQQKQLQRAEMEQTVSVLQNLYKPL